jgi:hypothetical protein
MTKKTFINRYISINQGDSLEEAINTKNHSIITFNDKKNNCCELSEITYFSSGGYNFNNRLYTNKEDLKKAVNKQLKFA